MVEIRPGQHTPKPLEGSDMAIEVSAQNPRSVKALFIFAACDRWQTGRTKAGRSFFGIPSESEPGLFHMVDARECTCRDFIERGGPDRPCKHVMAVKLWLAAFQAGAVSPKRGAAADGFDETVPTLLSYRELYPPCAAGCGELVERSGALCYVCGSNEAKRLEMAAKRAARSAVGV